MALIKCPECGKEISDRSESCINCGFPLKVENHSNKSLRRQPKYLNTSCKQKPSGTVLMVLVIALLLITGIIFVSVAFAFKNKNKEDISVKSDTTSTSEPSDFLQQEDEGLPLYLGMLGTETTDGHMDVSQNFIDNLQNVVIMKKAGSVSHKYVESGESAGLINKMSWVSNDTYTQDEFDAFIESMDLFFDYYGARDKDIDKSDKTYIWIDVLHSSRVLGWYADEKINLCWEWDERIASNPHSDSKDSYAGIPDDLMDSEMRRFLTYFEMQYAETGFNTNHSSNTMGTRYPVGKAKFLGEECSVLIWFSEKSVKSGLGAINSLQISYLGDLDFLEIKEEVVRILDCKLTKDSEHGFEVHIPGTDLVLSVYDDSPGLNGDIFITKYSESEEAPNVNPSTSPKSTTATTPASKPSSEESYNSARHKDSEAWGCAQDIVTNNLKCPSTAKFCSFVDATVTHLGNGEYMVTGWVDAENSFGAKIRENFVVTYTATSSGYKNGYAVFD